MKDKKSPLIAVDGVIIDPEKGILLIKRKNEPFKDHWALPGGFIKYGEMVEKALEREIREETGLTPTEYELLGVYSEPDRDPRGHVISIAYVISKTKGEAKANSDAKTLKYFRKTPKNIAFDHARIITDALKRFKKPTSSLRPPP